MDRLIPDGMGLIGSLCFDAGLATLGLTRSRMVFAVALVNGSAKSKA